MGACARDLAARIMVTDVQVPGLSGCCWAWRGAHDDAHRARIKAGGKSRQVRRLVLEAAGVPMNAADDAICLCSHAWCVNPQHLTRGNTEERRAFGRSGWIDLGTLWAARQFLAEQAFTEKDMANYLNVSAVLLQNAINRLQPAKPSVHLQFCN